jgi:prepilin-type N-terminal cleavage/methylation domain-containing protein
MAFKRDKRGFTLIEILVVIGLIAILAAIVLIAINPGRQFAQARNSQRESNVNTLLNAVGQLMADTKGVAVSATTCTSIVTAIPLDPTPAKHIGTAAGNVDLGCLVPTYIASAMPTDPTNGTLADTQYTIVASSTGRYTICAPNYAETAISNPPPAPYCLTR